MSKPCVSGSTAYPNPPLEVQLEYAPSPLQILAAVLNLIASPARVQIKTPRKLPAKMMIPLIFVSKLFLLVVATKANKIPTIVIRMRMKPHSNHTFICLSTRVNPAAIS